MTIVVLFALALLRIGASDEETFALSPVERATTAARDSTGCSPSGVSSLPDSSVSPDGRWRVLSEIENGGVRRIVIYDRRTGRTLFTGTYDISSFLWTKKSGLVLGISPIYDRPRIVMIFGNPVRSRVLVRASNRNKVYPAGADLFLVCSIGTDRGKTVLHYLRLPDVNKIDYGNFPKFTKQTTISIPER